jgi:hypothetical protein
MYQANERAVSNEVDADTIDELITKPVSEPLGLWHTLGASGRDEKTCVLLIFSI